MIVWDRFAVLVGMVPAGARRGLAPVARRWRSARLESPELADDLIRLGGILQLQPVDLQNGYPETAPLDGFRLAYEAGRADLARQLLALMGMTQTQIAKLTMENNDD